MRTSELRQAVRDARLHHAPLQASRRTRDHVDGHRRFIQKLPTHALEAFKSTLDEVREADLLLHVVDISHPDFEEQIKVVNNTLKDLGCADKPSMLIFNKIDAYTW